MSSSVRAVTHADRVVVHVTGEIDIFATGELRRQFEALIAQGRTDIVVDLSDVTFIDSTGLGVLVGALKCVRADGGRLELVTRSERILKALRITALSRLFTVHADVDAALSHRPDAVVPEGAAGAFAEDGSVTAPWPLSAGRVVRGFF